jgi:hypothetical protein
VNVGKILEIEGAASVRNKIEIGEAEEAAQMIRLEGMR